MKYYAYKMRHDYGFAPNPFGNICTLATCKPKIRRNAEIGDWIFGTGSKKMGLKYHLIYLMQVSNKITFQQYWDDPKYEVKKPAQNGSLLRLHGDNIYHENGQGKIVQCESLHSNYDGSTNDAHLKRDTKGKYVLISNNYYYFGEKNFLLPDHFLPVCSHVRDTIVVKDKELANEFVDWIKNNFKLGINGFPINWIEYRQLKMPI